MLPLAGIMFQLSAEHIAAICLSVILASPAIIALGVFSATLLSGQGRAGFMTILLTLPFLVPVVILSLLGIQNFPTEGIWSAEFLALAGISLILTAVCIPAGAGALNTHME